MDIRISPWFVLLVILFIAFDRTRFSVYLLVCAFLHEIGHILCAKIKGKQIESISAETFGVNMRLKEADISYKEEMLLAFSGPAVNLLLFFASVFMIKVPGVFIEDFQFLAGINAALFLINMIPIYPLDGGRIFFSVLKEKMDYDTAVRVNNAMSVIVLLPLLFLGFLILVVTGYNASLVLISVFLVFSVYKQFTGS